MGISEVKNKISTREERTCFDDREDHERDKEFSRDRDPTQQQQEKDTEYRSTVQDEAFKTSIGFPPGIDRDSRGKFVKDLNHEIKTEEWKSELEEIYRNQKDALVLVVPQLTVLPGMELKKEEGKEKRKWGFVQCGMGPNYEGGIFTLAVCRHEKRVQKEVREAAENKKLYVAVVSSRTTVRASLKQDFGIRDVVYLPYWVVSFHRVKEVFYTQKEMWTYFYKLKNLPHVLDLKRNDLNRLGDVFYPTQAAIAKYEGKIDDRQYPEWGLLENYEKMHCTNRHRVQSMYDQQEKDRVIRDAWYGYKGDSNDRDENMDIDDNTSNNKKEDNF